MSSETGNAESTKAAPEVSTTPIGMIRTGEGTLGLIDAEDPMSFITKNLRAGIEKQVPKEAAHEEKTEVPAVKKEEVKGSVPSKVDVGEGEPEFPIEVKEPVEEKTKTDTQEDPIETLEVKGKEESFKDVRKLLKLSKEQLKSKDDEIAAIKAENEKYKKGEIIPEPLLEVQGRLTQLQHFERLHELKDSEAYDATIIQPLEEVTNKAIELAKEYNAPEDVISQALSIESRRERDEFLLENFGQVGASKMEDLLSSMQALDKERKLAEKSPLDSLKLLTEKHRAFKTQQDAGKRKQLAAETRDGWIDSLLEVRKEAKIPELILREGEDEHNAVVKPVLERASSEYGKFITYLADNGIKKLPREVAKLLAKRFQLSEAALVAIEQRNQIYAENETLLKTTSRNTKILRPLSNGSAPAGIASGGTGFNKGPGSPEEAGRLLLKQVGAL